MKKMLHGRLTRRTLLTQGTFAVGAALLFGRPSCGGSSSEGGAAEEQGGSGSGSSSSASRSGGSASGGASGGTSSSAAGLIASPSLGGRRLFPDNNPWNTDILAAAVDPNSEALIASIGLDTGLHPDFGTIWEGAPIGIPYNVVGGDQRRVPVTFEYDDESDPGPYPIPPDALTEGNPDDEDSDAHVLIVDHDNWKLYELYAARKRDGGARWEAGSGAIFDLNSNALRPAGWTSADAAGLPILPGLVRYDEVMEQGAIRHALRFTAKRTRRAFVAPARHYASRLTDANLPPMGMRVRLKANYDISDFPPSLQVVLTALKTYGMFLADNGSNWFITGAPDPRWDDEELSEIRRVKGSAFEVARMGPLTTSV